MMRRFIIDSIVFWVTEYKIDGFRFDLMGLHDIETMNAVRAALDEIDPTILLYGEGWRGGDSPLPESEQAVKANVNKFDERLAVFSDDIRDGIKGHVFTAKEPGYVNGDFSNRDDIMFGVAASVFHPQVEYSRVKYSDFPWAIAPSQTVTYASSHDNLTLWDKFKETNPDATDAERQKMNKMSALLVFTSQGISFFQAGEEFARTKMGVENSYESPDVVNRLEWSRKSEYNNLYEYYRGLIALRKETPGFRLRTADEIATSIEFMETEPHLMAYTLKHSGQTNIVAVNVDTADHMLTLPEAGWDIMVDGDKAGTEVLGRVDSNTYVIPAQTGVVLVQRTADDKEAAPAVTEPAGSGDILGDTHESRGRWVGIALAAIAAAGVAVFAVIKRKKK
jgi:pullulanase